MGRIVVAGGYGNTGRPLVRLLLAHADRSVVVAGRDLDRAEAYVAELPEGRVQAARVDVTDTSSLTQVLSDAEVLVVAAGTSAAWQPSVEAALACGCHHLDVQIGSAKNTGLRAMSDQARKAGVSVVTDCGFHPGVPAAMVRSVAAKHPDLTTANVNSWIAVDWGGLGQFSRNTVGEMVQEFADYRYEAYVGGRWTAPKGTRSVAFPPPVGRGRVAAMGLDEMREVVREVPTLRDAGFFVGGFPNVVNYGVIPMVYAAMKVAPKRAAPQAGRLLEWGLRRFSRPPYITYLQLDGGAAGETPRPLLRLTHSDAYVLTAAPVVATIRQLLDGCVPAGVHLQGMAVEPAQFFADLAAMGIDVWQAD